MQSSLSVEIELALHATSAGGRRTPILSGYRPVCRVQSNQGRPIDVGLCVLRLIGRSELAPGAASDAVLDFHPSVARFVTANMHPGSTFELAEGACLIAEATVIAVRPVTLGSPSFPMCSRCDEPVMRHKDSYETFERMHWSCFHYEYEHRRSSGHPRVEGLPDPHFLDPDVACGDPACPARAF